MNNEWFSGCEYEDPNVIKARDSSRCCVATYCSSSANIHLALIELILAPLGSGTKSSIQKLQQCLHIILYCSKSTMHKLCSTRSLIVLIRQVQMPYSALIRQHYQSYHTA